jgi:hypothetical protein
MLVKLELTRMRWRCSLVFVTILVTVASLRALQVAQKTCKGGGKIALEISYDVSFPIFTYHLSEPKSFSAARVEVWDRPVRLSVIPVPVRKEGEIEWAPKKAPPDTPSWLFIRVVDPRGRSDAQKVFIGGATNDGGGPGPSFPNQSFVLEEGAVSAALTVEGTNLTPLTHFLLSEQQPSGTWIAREDLSGVLVDLEHVSVEVPPGYLSRPTVLNLESMPPGLVSPGDQKYPRCCSSITVNVMSKDRPVLSEIDPKEISADSLTDGVTVRLSGSGFGPESSTVVDLDGDVPDFAKKTVFVSPNELLVTVDRDFLHGYSDARKADRFQFRVRNSDDFHVSDTQELRILPTAQHPAKNESVPLITSTSPYPVPLMDFQSPDYMRVAVYGEKFREDNHIVLSVDDGPEVKLETEYVSPQELHVLIPRELWKDHRLSYRLITKTAAGTCSTEVWEEE